MSLSSLVQTSGANTGVLQGTLTIGTVKSNGGQLEAEGGPNPATTVPVTVTVGALTGTGTYGAEGAKSVFIDNSANDPGNSFFFADNGVTVEIASRVASSSYLDYDETDNPATFALENPGELTRATLEGLAAGDTLELPGTSVSSVVIGSNYLNITTSAGEYVFDNVSYDGEEVTNYSASFDAGTGLEAITFNNEPACFLRGTLICTRHGEVPVESLQIGDEVITRSTGTARIKWIGTQRLSGRFVRNNRDQIPVKIAAGALGAQRPRRDLYISPGHSMLLGETLVLGKNLVNGLTITQDEIPEQIDYFHIELDAHDCLIAEGAWSETFADGPGLRDRYDNAAEFRTRYPGYRVPDAPTLCAQRPLRGPALDAALRPVVALAGVAHPPGAMRGYLDWVGEDGTVAGWALDSRWPELPVELEILLDGAVVGSVLACDPREDLRSAGLGQGHCSFSFRIDQVIQSHTPGSVQVRRTTDKMPLNFTDELMGRIVNG